MSFKDINPLWQLSDPLTVQQAAALIAGFDPNSVHFSIDGSTWFENGTGLTDSEGIGRVQTALSSLVNAVNAGKLKATIRRAAWERGWDEEPGEGERFTKDFELLTSDTSEAWGADPFFATRVRGLIYRVSPDWGLTTVDRAELVSWLERSGMRTGFFFPRATDDADYLDPNHPRYAPKLAAAVRAWRAVTDPNGKHPKQALEKWLREHAAEFGMTDANGKPNETGIEEVAKVANWQPSGGAPKTPARR